MVLGTIIKMALGGGLPSRQRLSMMLQHLGMMVAYSAFLGLSLVGLTALALLGFYHILIGYGLAPMVAGCVIFMVGCGVSFIALLATNQQREKLLDSFMSVSEESSNLPQIFNSVLLSFVRGFNDGAAIPRQTSAEEDDDSSISEMAKESQPRVGNGHAYSSFN